MPKGGFEPPLPYGNYALNVARLPVPPLRHVACIINTVGAGPLSSLLAKAKLARRSAGLPAVGGSGRQGYWAPCPVLNVTSDVGSASTFTVAPL